MTFLDKVQVELGLIELLRQLGYEYAFGPDIACDDPRPVSAPVCRPKVL